MIKFKNVSLKYIDNFYSLLNANFEIESSVCFFNDEIFSRFAIMRTLAKIDKYYSGEIFVDNKNLKHYKDKELPIAYCPKKAELFNSNIEKNLKFPLKIRKINKNLIKNIINNAIFNYLKEFPSKISKLNNSQKKIVSLVRAILRNPKYVLLEDFFDDLDNEFFDLANKIISNNKDIIFIASCEKFISIPCFENFNKYDLTKNKYI